jgi:uncharacterized alkaline shock family protein YloU
MDTPDTRLRDLSASLQPVSTDSLMDDSELTDAELMQLGRVRIAPAVLRTVIEQAALRMQGVARMAGLGDHLSQYVGRALPRHGVGLTVKGEVVDVDLYLIVEPWAHLVEVGAAVQESVGAAIEHILGMRARTINVYIQDVA